MFKVLIPFSYICSDFLEDISRKSHSGIEAAVSAGLIMVSDEIATFNKVAIIQDTDSYVQ